MASESSLLYVTVAVARAMITVEYVGSLVFRTATSLRLQSPVQVLGRDDAENIGYIIPSEASDCKFGKGLCKYSSGVRPEQICSRSEDAAKIGVETQQSKLMKLNCQQQ